MQSYAGKYVPSISHFIVQAAAMHDGTAHTLRKVRALPADVEAPVFKLGGLAIGNGFTEAVEQTLVQVRRAWWPHARHHVNPGVDAALTNWLRASCCWSFSIQPRRAPSTVSLCSFLSAH